MVLWQEIVNVSHLHRLYSEGKINLIQLANGIVGRLKTTSFYASADPDFMDVLEEFSALNELSAHEDYEIAFDYLLDFGDVDNRLWIETEKKATKYEIEEDNRAIKIEKKMLDDYDGPQVNIDVSNTEPTFKGPYYQPGVPLIKASPASNNSSFTSSATSSSKYNKRKQVRYLSDYEFDKRLKEKGIRPSAMSRDFYNYVRDSQDDYQAWVMDRFAENIEGYVDMKPEVAALGS